MKHIVVTAMRKTALGMFAPRVVYTIDDSGAKAKAVIKALVEGKDASGRPTRAPAVGRIVSEAEAKELRETWAQQQAVEYGGSEQVEQAEGEGAINTINLESLIDRAKTAEAEQAVLTARAETAEAEKAALMERIEALTAQLEAKETPKPSSTKAKAADSK